MVATQKAGRRVARLPDGSTVEMSGDSAIEVRYSKGRRDIRLMRGQALFEVTHNAARPFIVKAGKGEIRALGTAFDVDLTRSEEHTSELQSLIRISYAGFCLKKKTTNTKHTYLA